MKTATKLLITLAPFILVANSAESKVENSHKPACQLWSVAIQGGVMPSSYLSRDRFTYTSQGIPTPPTASSFKFGNLFEQPYTFGLEIARDITCNWQLFLEGSYYHAKAKSYTFNSVGLNITQTPVDNFKSFGVYFGGRYKIDTKFESFAPYVGAKIGFIHYNAINNLEEFNNAPIPSQTIPYRPSGTAVSGGLHIGFDYLFTSNFSLGLKAEVIFSGGRKGAIVRNAAPSPIIDIGSTGPFISYPFQIVARYRFH